MNLYPVAFQVDLKAELYLFGRGAAAFHKLLSLRDQTSKHEYASRPRVGRRSNCTRTDGRRYRRRPVCDPNLSKRCSAFYHLYSPTCRFAHNGDGPDNVQSPQTQTQEHQSVLSPVQISLAAWLAGPSESAPHLGPLNPRFVPRPGSLCRIKLRNNPRLTAMCLPIRSTNRKLCRNKIETAEVRRKVERVCPDDHVVAKYLRRHQSEGECRHIVTVVGGKTWT